MAPSQPALSTTLYTLKQLAAVFGWPVGGQLEHHHTHVHVARGALQQVTSARQRKCLKERALRAWKGAADGDAGPAVPRSTATCVRTPPSERRTRPQEPSGGEEGGADGDDACAVGPGPAGDTPRGESARPPSAEVPPSNPSLEPPPQQQQQQQQPQPQQQLPPPQQLQLPQPQERLPEGRLGSGAAAGPSSSSSLLMPQFAAAREAQQALSPGAPSHGSPRGGMPCIIGRRGSLGGGWVPRVAAGLRV